MECNPGDYPEPQPDSGPTQTERGVASIFVPEPQATPPGQDPHGRVLAHHGVGGSSWGEAAAPSE